MDWFDQYLDGLADHTNVVYPPDSHTWRPVRPTKQQESLIQDSFIADMVRMRNIQEARREEEEQGMGGSYGSIDAGSSPTAKEGSVTPPTPPGPSPFALTYLTEEIVYNGENLTYGA